MDLKIFPPEEIVETTVQLPLSKSISNRALIMTALASGDVASVRAARCEDTDAMRTALTDAPKSEKNIGAAGTAMRFLTAYYAALEGAEVTLDGTERMRRRPIGKLVEALRSLGANITYLGEDGFPPLKISGTQLSGGSIEVDATQSSQFVSALLMVAPTMTSSLTVKLLGEVASLPYIDMTIGMMQGRGIEVERSVDVITVCPGAYSLNVDDAEPDWSAASYWYEIAALTAGWVTLPGLAEHSLQGDSRLAEIFEKLGVVTAFSDEDEDGNFRGSAAELSASPELFSRLDLDLSETPDLVPALAVTCCMLSVPFRFSGLSNLRIKESDRIEALCRELRKVSFLLEVEGDDVLAWEGERCPILEVPVLDTYSDHRMAMAFAPVAVFAPGIVVRDAEVVAKSYPDYWTHLQNAGFTLIDPSQTEQNTEAEV